MTDPTPYAEAAKRLSARLRDGSTPRRPQDIDDIRAAADTIDTLLAANQAQAEELKALRAGLNTALTILAAIMKMSDSAQSLGGASCIAGVASLHTMQTSIQKNGQRLASLAALLHQGDAK